MNKIIRTVKTRTIGLIAIAVTVAFTAISCADKPIILRFIPIDLSQRLV
jgi:hypothetical protein